MHSIVLIDGPVMKAVHDLNCTVTNANVLVRWYNWSFTYRPLDNRYSVINTGRDIGQAWWESLLQEKY